MGWHSQQYGSFERFLVALAHACAAAGLETHLVFPDEPESRSFVQDVPAAVHLVPSPAGITDARFSRNLAQIIRSLRPTHLHAHFGLDAYEALLVAATFKVPRRFTTKHITPSGSRVSALRHRALAALVNVVFAVSDEVGNRLAALGVPSGKIKVVHLGVDLAAYGSDPTAANAVRLELGLPAETRLVVSTSHLRPGKGVELLPPVAAALAREPGDACVLVAGGGPLRHRLEAEARRLGLGDDDIRLLGVREDVPRLLAAADVFLFPTVGTEGYPLGPLEALAAATPVVASAVGDLSASLAGVVEIVPPGDVEALVEACRRLLSDPARAAALGAAGRRLIAERFSTMDAADHYVSTYVGPPLGEA